MRPLGFDLIRSASPGSGGTGEMESLGAYGSDSEEEKEKEEEEEAAAPPPAFSIPGGDSEVRKLSHTCPPPPPPPLELVSSWGLVWRFAASSCWCARV